MKELHYKFVLCMALVLAVALLSAPGRTVGMEHSQLAQADIPSYLPLIINGQGKGTLRVQAVLDDGAGGAGEPLGAGVIIRLNGVEVGVTNGDGVLVTDHTTGRYSLEAVLPSLAIGNTDVTLTHGKTTAVTVVLDGNGEVIEPSQLVLEELVNRALPLDTPTITLRFMKNGVPVAISMLEEVELDAVDPNFFPDDLTSWFTLGPDGSIVATDANLVNYWVSSVDSDAQLRVAGTDARGLSYHGVVTFTPGTFSVVGQLAAPPSQPSLALGGIPIQATFSNGIQQTIRSAADGSFQILNVPSGTLNLSTNTQQGGKVYTGVADFAVDGNKQILVRMLGLTDILNGVASWEVSNLPTNQPLRPSVEQQQLRRESAAAQPESAMAHTETPTATEATEVEIYVVAAAEDVGVSDSATLDVAKGTEKVILKYEVSTAEYPYYVLRQSRYNDTWRLSVLASSGAQLFSIGRAVNSQLYSPPTWNANGSTGELQQEIDVSALAANNDIQLILHAVSTNIGDALLSTSVRAKLGAEESIVINTVTNDQVVPTTGQSDHFSIPRPGDTNTFHRTFDVAYSKPDDVEITGVTVELLDDIGTVLQTILDDEAPGSARVQQVNDSTLRVQVTFSDEASQVASTPPPSEQIRYRFKLKGRAADDEVLESDPKESAAYFALWRMPDGLARYGMRDQGRDDWAAQSTYSWLDDNRALVTRIDDISGEHARNIGHQTHHQGRDIDMFHVYTFPNGAVSGTQNYLRLVENVQAALNGDAAALNRVNAWASQTRDRFDDLIADNNVRRIYYAIGGAVAGEGQTTLTAGWAQQLLEQGTYTNPDGLTINLAAGGWGNAGDAKMRYNATHNNHFHVALQRP